jgi:membrane fusion protein (multidrug efflux system)
MSKFIASLIVLAVLAAGSVYLYQRLSDDGVVAAEQQDQAGSGEGAPAEEQAGPPQGMPPTAVEAAPVKIGAIVRTIRAVGSLRSEESVMIASEIAGRVKEILVEEGQRVPKDAPLVLLDSSIYEAELAKAQASLALNRANMERARALRERGTGTELAVDEANAALRADQAAISLAQAWLDKATLFAPFDGVLGLRSVSVGEYVEPGEVIFNLEATDRLKADFRIPEVSMQQLKIGQQIELMTDAMPGRRFPGTVYAIDPKIDPDGRSLVLRALVPNEDGALRPGLFVRVDLIVGTRDNAIIIPEQALVPVGDDLFVYRVVEGKAAMTQVLIGQRRAGEVEVTEGLTREDVVIFEGQIKIGDGAPVQVVTGQGQGGGQEQPPQDAASAGGEEAS